MLLCKKPQDVKLNSKIKIFFLKFIFRKVNPGDFIFSAWNAKINSAKILTEKILQNKVFL